jgi:hypothetical protein
LKKTYFDLLRNVLIDHHALNLVAGTRSPAIILRKNDRNSMR